MMTVIDIADAYMTARRNKRRSPDQVEFELHWEANCMKLYDDIVSRDVKPTAYTFVTDYPKPREVFASDMATRVMHHYIDMRLRPLLEKRMGPHTFNNRIGMGQNACQNALISDIYEISRGFTTDAWIIKVDMSGCFPNIRQDIAYRQLENVILEDYKGNDIDDVLFMLMVCVFSYPTHHCYRKSPISKWDKVAPEKSLFNKPDGVGAAIGHLIWQNAVNYYFHEIDEWFDEIGVCHERFVDDMVFVVNSKTFLLVIPELRARLAKLGAKLNDNKFYCQHYTKGCEWIGTHIKMDRIYLNNRIVKRGKLKTKAMNRHIDADHVDKMISSINSYLGMCKNTNGFNRAMEIVGKLSPKWWQYVRLNRERLCIQPLPDYSKRNLIINHYKLLTHDTIRKRRSHSASTRNHRRMREEPSR